jgi:ABC-type transport system substrate-binding protein
MDPERRISSRVIGLTWIRPALAASSTPTRHGTIPADSTEVCGSKVLDQLFSGLYEYDAETYEPIPVMATSLESDDAQNWTVTIRDDFTFHDGTPVTAQSFVDAWNFVVDPEAGNRNANFFENFVGYDEVQAGEADTMTGVEAVDETTITIQLKEPFSPLETQLGYTAFYPMPEAAFDDLQAWNQAPIGNGRYQMDGQWEHDQQIAMVRYEDWPGDEPGLADRTVQCPQLPFAVHEVRHDVEDAGLIGVVAGAEPGAFQGADDAGRDVLRHLQAQTDLTQIVPHPHHHTIRQLPRPGVLRVHLQPHLIAVA